MATGDISSLDELDLAATGTSPVWVKAWGDTWALFYRDTSGDIAIKTYTINPSTGLFSAVLDSETTIYSGYPRRAERRRNGVVALWWDDLDNVCRIYTFAIGSGGAITATALDTYSVAATTPIGMGNWAKLSADYYAWCITKNAVIPLDVTLMTTKVESDGTITAVDSATLWAANKGWASPKMIYPIKGDIYATALPNTNHTRVQTFDISSTGVINDAEVDYTQVSGYVNEAEKGSLGYIGNNWAAIMDDDKDRDECNVRSIGIADDGTIDNAYTDLAQDGTHNFYGGNILALGMDMFVVGHNDAVDGNGKVWSHRMDSAGAISDLDSFEWDNSLTVVNNWDHTCKLIANDIVLVYSSEGNTLKSETLQIEQPDGIYVVLNDNIVLSDYVHGISTNRGKDNELGTVQTGLCELICDNFYGDFSPENGASKFYPDIAIGSKIKVYEIFNGTRYFHFTGTIDAIAPRAEITDPVAYITCFDGMDGMAQTEIETFIFTATDTNAMITTILNEIGWGAPRSLDSGIDVLAVAWFHEIKALEAIHKLEKQEKSMFLIGEDGTAIWEDRHHRLGDPHLTSQYDFADNVVSLEYAISKRDVINWAKVIGHQYTQAPDHLQPMWSCPTGTAQAPWVPPKAGGVNGTLVIWAMMDGPMESLDATVLEKGVDWDVYIDYDKSGGASTKITADCSLAYVAYGQAIKITITNTNTSTGGFVVYPDAPRIYVIALGTTTQTLFIAGYLYKDDSFTVSNEDTDSQRDYGKRTRSVECTFKSNANDIAAYAQWLATNFKDPFPNPVGCSIVARQSDAIRTQCLARKISDRITVSSGRLGIDRDFFINRVEQEYVLKEGGTIHNTSYALDAAGGHGGGSGDQVWLLSGVEDDIYDPYSRLEETTWLGF